jgi:signal transduction histidine kinase
VASPTAEDATAGDVVDFSLQVLASTAWLLVLAALVGVVASRITARRLLRRVDRLSALASEFVRAPAADNPETRGSRPRSAKSDSPGLARGLEKVASTYRTRLNAPVNLRVDPALQGSNVAPELELAVLGIAEEAIANAVRHSRAGRIDLEAGLDRGSLVLVVADDGRGFRPDRVADRGGTGLGLIRERVLELEGSLDLETSPGRGVRITVTVPLGD